METALIPSLDDIRHLALADMESKFLSKKNSYDGHISEKSYWTCEDCISLVKMATSEREIKIAQRIFNRFHYWI